MTGAGTDYERLRQLALANTDRRNLIASDIHGHRELARGVLALLGERDALAETRQSLRVLLADALQGREQAVGERDRLREALRETATYLGNTFTYHSPGPVPCRKLITAERIARAALSAVDTPEDET